MNIGAAVGSNSIRCAAADAGSPADDHRRTAIAIATRIRKPTFRIDRNMTILQDGYAKYATLVISLLGRGAQLDRNIFTERDAVNAQSEINSRRTNGDNDKIRNGGMTLGGTEYPKPDQPIARLAKYIPAEALSLYLALAGIADSASTAPQNGQWWFYALAATTIVFNVLYLRILWHVSRWSQIAISCLALVVYAVATGGPLVQTIPVYTPLAGTIALTVMTAFLAFFQPPEPLGAEHGAGAI